MKTGIDTIDAQHRKLIETVNQLDHLLGSGKTIGERELKTTLAWLAEYSTGHFRHEEACMYVYKCPAAKQNRAAHQQFCEALEQFTKRHVAGEKPGDLMVEMEAYLSSWLFNHLCNVDSALVACVSKQKDYSHS